MLKHFNAFYQLQRDKEHVPLSCPVEMHEADIYSDLLGRLELDGDFFGLVDSRGAVLQVLYEAGRDTYWLEIPDPARRGSYSRRCSFDQVVDVFKSLPEYFTSETVSNLSFESWPR